MTGTNETMTGRAAYMLGYPGALGAMPESTRSDFAARREFVTAWAVAMGCPACRAVRRTAQAEHARSAA